MGYDSLYTFFGDREMNEDNWKHRTSGMRCGTCMYFVVKEKTETAPGVERELGRCRRNAPTMKGWPALFSTDWCGDHKLDENKI
jgi:hypothetical protein